MVNRTCTVDDCGRTHYAKDLCHFHWQRKRRRGTVNPGPLRMGPEPLPRVTPEAKPCGRCQTEKPASSFSRRSSTPTGLSSWCRSCSSAVVRERRKAGKDATTAKAWIAADKAANPEKYRAKSQAYYDKHSELIRARASEWRLQNPEKDKELHERRRARILGTRTERVDVLALWSGLCALCGEVLDESTLWPDPQSPSLDHIVPLSKGGTHTTDNLQWTHLRCNLRKGTRIFG